MAINKIKTNSISDSAVTSATIQDSAVTNAKISACAAIAQSKVSGLATSLSTLCSSATALTGLINTNQYNIALLGFKMAVTDGLTVFNLVDGVVDEFQDESGVDNSASTNLNYCGTDDFYTNLCSVPISAGFTTTTVTEPDTSVAGTNPAIGTMVGGTFTVPTGATSVNAYIWGAGGGAGGHEPETKGFGGGGGFVSGTVAVTPSQVIGVFVAEGGQFGLPASPQLTYGNGGGFGVHPVFPGTQKGGGGVDPAGGLQAAGGAGLGAIASQTSSAFSAPTMFLVAGGGGGGGSPNGTGGAGGGLIGDAYNTTTEQTNRGPSPSGGGGGGSQTVGGQGGTGPLSRNGQSGGLFYGGNGYFGGGGGGGYYGGGGSGYCGGHPAGGGGSSYYGHPQITSGSTEEGQGSQGGGVPSPLYTASTNEGGTGNLPSPQITSGEDGYVLITGSAQVTGTSTIISDPFTSTTVPTTTRIVVFEENVGTPTLNTDIIASVSRNGGTNFTTVTLTDSGYVTGAAGQRILTGTATISGQPSGQSMKWKLQLANNTVKIHGVALQWS